MTALFVWDFFALILFYGIYIFIPWNTYRIYSAKMKGRDESEEKCLDIKSLCSRYDAPKSRQALLDGKRVIKSRIPSGYFLRKCDT